MYISTKELAERTGATKRQIEYWCITGIISSREREKPNSGVPREFDYSLVDKVRVLTNVSNALHEINLKIVYDNIDVGYVYIGDNILLSW